MDAKTNELTSKIGRSTANPKVKVTVPTDAERKAGWAKLKAVQERVGARAKTMGLNEGGLKKLTDG